VRIVGELERFALEGKLKGILGDVHSSMDEGGCIHGISGGSALCLRVLGLMQRFEFQHAKAGEVRATGRTQRSKGRERTLPQPLRGAFRRPAELACSNKAMLCNEWPHKRVF
jgi:hypothetical protein